ncbi:MAG: FHA domain-containing protein [Anaerolineales bacterium]
MSAKKETPIAFLIVDGNRVISLEKGVINIGRKSDNHVVIKDQHVSRYHAQIRRIQEHYVLMDLDSTVGTSVNGKEIKQVYLKPGDVISIAGVPLIFGIGNPSQPLEFPTTGPQNVRTGPTDTVTLNEADAYLDLFNTPENEDEQRKP